MAPAGSHESLIAAIQGGADSVYFGVGKLNMRAKSSINFSLDELEKISSICRKHKIKSYITLNTVIYDSDIGYMTEIMKKIRDYIEGHDFTSFSKEEITQDAVIRNLEIIGEASRNLTEETRLKTKKIP